MVAASILILCVGLMVAGVILMRQDKPVGKPMAAIGAVISIVIVLLIQFGVFEKQVKVESIFQAQTDNASQRFGRYLAQQFPNARVVIIKPYPYLHKEEVRQGMISGLTRELDGKMTIVKTVDPQLPDWVQLEFEKRLDQTRATEAEIPNLNDWFTADHFDPILAEHATDCDIVISLAGLPEDSRRMTYWQRADRPKLALGFSMARLPARRIASGDIVAAVTYRLKTPADAELPQTDDEVVAAFNRRYHLVTPDNVAEKRAKQPRLFVRPRQQS